MILSVFLTGVSEIIRFEKFSVKKLVVLVIIILEEWGSAVSYTHLDVYKRQGEGLEKREDNFADEVANMIK